MSEYQLLDEKRYPLKVREVIDNANLLSYYRWEHRVTIGYNGRRFMVFIDNLGTGKGPILYIEEITSGSSEKIKDESLFQSLIKFATEKGFLGVFPPLWKHSLKENEKKILSKRIIV